MPSIDLELLLRLRLVVCPLRRDGPRRWWNTKGQLGELGAACGQGAAFHGTHRFAQARSVFAVAAHRCEEGIRSARHARPCGDSRVEIEEQFDARWEHWLDDAADWKPFFEERRRDQVARISWQACARSAWSRPRPLEAVAYSEAARRGGPCELPRPSAHPRTRRRLSLGLLRCEDPLGRSTVPYARRKSIDDPASRANVVSSFTIIKGAMIDETYAVFAAWDFDARSARTSIASATRTSSARRSATWLRDVAKVLNRRFDPDGRDRAARRPRARRLRARGVEAAPPLAHDARRVPRSATS